jgi:hypothetical protein
MAKYDAVCANSSARWRAMGNNRMVYCLTRKLIPYQIDLNRLDEMNWDSHMRGKDWVKMEEFRLAFDTAREMLASGALIARATEYGP